MKNKPTGCFVAVIIAIILIGVVGVAAFLFLFNGRQVSYEGVAEPTERGGWVNVMAPDSEAGILVLKRDEMRDLLVPDAGAEITRERFAAFMIEDDVTELAKSAFREMANGATVKWLLRTENVMDRNGTLHGEFDLPWQIKEGNSTMSSTISVGAEFTDESRADLLKLRRGDWTTVQGELSFSGQPVILKNARLAPRPDE